MEMPEDSYFAELIVKVDKEIQRLENLAKPDSKEVELLQKCDADPRNLDLQFDLVEHLLSKNKREEVIPVLLNIIAVDRNYGDRKAHKTLMDTFAQLGAANEKVKQGKKKLGSILL